MWYAKCYCLCQCRILNKLTPEKFDLLKGQLIDAGITSADILKVSSFNDLTIFLLMLRFLIVLLCNTGCHFAYI